MKKMMKEMEAKRKVMKKIYHDFGMDRKTDKQGRSALEANCAKIHKVFEGVV